MELLKKIPKGLLFALMMIAFLVVARAFLIPFLFGLLIALIIYPVCKKLESKKISRGLSAFISISLVLIFFFGIIFLLIIQVRVLNKDLPQLITGLGLELAKAQNWISANLGISLPEQKDILLETRKNMSGSVKDFISGIASGLFNLIIIPFYAGLFLYYRTIIVNFISSVAGPKYKEELPRILNEAIHTYFNYIKGMILVYLSVGILNSAGLFLLGVKYPLLFGMLTAFMTIIPYFGIIISSLLPISISWMETKSIYVPLGIVGVFSFVQYLEAYFIFPYIVGKQLNINTFASIVLIIIGGLMWGVSGMVLFLPYAALLKIVSGRIEELKPFCKLLEIPSKKK